MAKFNLGIGDKLLNDTSREMKITGEWAFELIPRMKSTSAHTARKMMFQI